MWTLIALLDRFDPNAANWESVEWAREMASVAADLGIPYAVTDREGRACVDAMPDVDVYEAEPVTLRNPRMTYSEAA